MKFHEMLADKFVDGLFIFVGVYVAFHFNQCQQDHLAEQELKFNLEQIMRDLPLEDPKQDLDPYVFKQVKKEDGTCSTALSTDSANVTGRTYLDVIKHRGLGNFLKDKTVVPMLTAYYDTFMDRASSSHDQFIVAYKKETAQINNTKCLSDKKIKEISQRLFDSHYQYSLDLTTAYLIGVQIKKRLNDLGYHRPGEKTLRVEVDFKYGTSKSKSIISN